MFGLTLGGPWTEQLLLPLSRSGMEWNGTAFCEVQQLLLPIQNRTAKLRTK